MRGRRWWRGTAALGAAAVLIGCSPSSNGPETGPGSLQSGTGPLVAEDVVRLDLREAPTAQEAGIGPERPDLVLSRVGDAIDTQLELPAGRLSLSAFGVNIGGPVGAPDPTYAETIVVNVRGGDTAAVARELLGQAPVLGIDPAQVQQWAVRSDSPGPYDNAFFESPLSTTGPATTGPATTVEVRRDDGEQSWTVNYRFDFAGPPAAGA